MKIINPAIRGAKAFTLVELLIVIGIVLILATATVRGVAGTQRNLAFNNTYAELITLVQRARNLALSREAVSGQTVKYGVLFRTSDKSATLYSRHLKADTEVERYAIPADYSLNLRLPGGTSDLVTAYILYDEKGTTELFWGPTTSTLTDVLNVELTQIQSGRSRLFSVNRVSGIPQ